MTGRISDDPEGWVSRWLLKTADEIERGDWTLESHTQSFPPGADMKLYEFTILLRVKDDDDE